MLRQYAPPRFRCETIRGRTLAVGIVPIGEIFRHAPSRGARLRTYIVDAWMSRAYARADRTGRFSYLARGGHLALVRDLATVRQMLLADAIIRACLDGDPPGPLRMSLARPGSRTAEGWRKGRGMASPTGLEGGAFRRG